MSESAIDFLLFRTKTIKTRAIPITAKPPLAPATAMIAVCQAVNIKYRIYSTCY